MRAPLSIESEPSLEVQLVQLQKQLHEFEAVIQAQQQRHEHVRALEADLAGMVRRAGALLDELAGLRDQVREAAEAATREALSVSDAHVAEFQRRAARIVDAYADAVRAAQQTVARAEARIDTFDERIARELAQAGREVREAATVLRERAAETAAAATRDAPAPRSRRLIPALFAAALLVAALAGYFWVAGSLRDASARTDAAERQARETSRDATQQIAAIERSAQQATRDAQSTAARTERLVSVLAAPDTQRAILFAQQRAADASGRVFWSPSRGVVVTAARLPSLDATDTYQVWLTTTRRAVSLGFLAPDDAGRATGAFDLPPELAGLIRGFMVTRERAGGSSRPGGRVVLAS